MNGSDSNAPISGSGGTGIYCTLLSSAYTYSSSHQYYSSLTGQIGTDQEITSPTTTNGVLKGTNCTWTSVAGGSTVNSLVIYRKNAGANTTWDLIAYLDTNITGLPAATNGGNITVTWDSNGIFAL